jgi:hypothetical protein
MAKAYCTEGNTLEISWDARVIASLHIMLETALQFLDNPIVEVMACNLSGQPDIPDVKLTWDRARQPRS